MESLRIRRSWTSIFWALLVLAWMTASAVRELRDGRLPPVLIYLGLVWFVVVAVRFATTPFAQLGPRGLAYYGYLRTRSIEWDAIERVELNPSKQLRVLPFDARPLFISLGEISRSQREVFLRVMKERLEGSLTSASS